jgi:MFS family permease
VAIFATAASPAMGYVVVTFVLSYGPKQVGYTRNDLLVMIIVASALQIFATLATASIADRFGRLRTMLIGSVIQFAAALAFFPLFDSGVWLLALVACTLGACTNSAQYAPLPAVMSDLFPTKLRYSGSSLGYQFGSIVGGSLAPLIATAIFASTGSSLMIGVYLAALTVVSAIAIAFAHTPALKVDLTKEEPAPLAVRK